MNTKSVIAAAILLLLVSVDSMRAADNPQIDRLLRELKAEKASVRAHAAADIGRLGPEGTKAVPALMKALKDDSLLVRHEALNALGQIGPAARAAVPELIELAKSKEAKDSRLLLDVMSTLGSIGHDAADAAPLLTEYLSAEDERVAGSAAYALAQILPTDSDELKQVVPRLVKGLQSKHRQLKYEAFRGLATIGEAAVPALAELIGNHENDPHSAAAAAAALQMVGPAAAPAVPALREALKSRHELVVANAADAAGSIGPAAKDVLPQLQKMVTSDHILLRTHAVQNIGRLREAAAPATGELTQALRDKDANVRREAAQSLGEIGPPAKRATPALIAALKDESQAVVVAAAHALARIGPEAVEYLTPLIKDRQLGRWAVVILSEAGPAAAPAVDTLRSVLAKEDSELVAECIFALGQIGPKAKDAVPDLMKIAEDQEQDSKRRAQAVFALGNIRSPEAIPVIERILKEKDDRDSKDKKAKDETKLPLVAAGALMLIERPARPEHLKLALPKLIAALDDKSPAIRREAAVALRQVGAPAASATPALLEGLKDRDPTISINCLWALTAIAPETAASSLVPAIIPLLSSPVPQMRYTACYAAGTLGPAAEEAIPVLEKNLHEPDQFLQIASAWALVRIQPKPQTVEDCIDALIHGLRSTDSRVRGEAVSTLGLLGAKAARALPALTELADDPDPALRKTATESIAAIRGADDRPAGASSSRRTQSQR